MGDSTGGAGGFGGPREPDEGPAAVIMKTG